MEFIRILIFFIVCSHPNWKPWSKIARHPRDVTWSKPVGDGKIFGTLGNNDQGLFVSKF